MADEPQTPGVWQKGGPSPNPGGKNKVQREVQAILDEAAPHAARRLIELCASENEKVAAACVRDVLDRTLGRPGVSENHSEEVVNAVLAALLSSKKVQ